MGKSLPGNFLGKIGNEATDNATTNDPNLNTSVLSRGSGLNVSSLANASKGETK